MTPQSQPQTNFDFGHPNLMTFFIYSFPLYLVRELLTFFVKYKGMALVQIAYSIIVQLHPEIMACSQETDFLSLFQKLRKQQFCERHIKINNILVSAKSFATQQIKVYLEKVPLLNNAYVSYFKLEDNDRKMKNVEIMGQLHEERKQFLKAPTSQRFSRNLADISILDGLESICVKKIYHSLMNKENRQSVVDEYSNKKMWMSDFMHLGLKKENGDKLGDQLMTIPESGNEFSNIIHTESQMQDQELGEHNKRQ